METQNTKLPFFEIKEGVKVIVRPMTKEEARVTFPYRPFTKYSESRFGGNELYDDTCLLLNSLAVRCKMCQAPTKKEFLCFEVWPDCDGSCEGKAGLDPQLPKDQYYERASRIR